MINNCPECGESWKGREMTPHEREAFGGNDEPLQEGVCFSRLVGVVPGTGVEIDRWECPDCKTQFPKVSGSSPGHFSATPLRIKIPPLSEPIKGIIEELQENNGFSSYLAGFIPSTTDP